MTAGDHSTRDRLDSLSTDGYHQLSKRLELLAISLATRRQRPAWAALCFDPLVPDSGAGQYLLTSA